MSPLSKMSLLLRFKIKSSQRQKIRIANTNTHTCSSSWISHLSLWLPVHFLLLCLSLSQPGEVTPCVQCDTELSPPTPCITPLPPAGPTSSWHPDTQTPSQPLHLRWHENWQQWTSLSILSLIHFNFSMYNYVILPFFSLLVFNILTIYLKILQQESHRRLYTANLHLHTIIFFQNGLGKSEKKKHVVSPAATTTSQSTFPNTKHGMN